MIDMYRQPEKLLQVCDMILERRIAQATPSDPKQRGNPKRIGMPLWRGDKAFMSDKQFEKFYWPGLKKSLQVTIDLGYVPIPFFEAEFGDRLERLLELPKGKLLPQLSTWTPSGQKNYRRAYLYYESNPSIIETLVSPGGGEIYQGAN